jgi:MerR family mercuric resistance operon transcriptional regulator
MSTYTIGQLAKAAAVPTSTLRFYERTRLLTPATRSESNYRQYDSAALERLRFIRAAQATGFSIEDIRELLSLTHSDDPPCDDVLSLMTNRLAEVRERLKKLRHVERILSRSLKQCCSGKDIDLCGEITRLRVTAGQSRAGSKKLVLRA